MQDTAVWMHAGYSCADAGRTQLCAAGLITAKLPAAACDGTEEGQQTKFQEVPDPPSPLPPFRETTAASGFPVLKSLINFVLF
jgi:hypothetical protein